MKDYTKFMKWAVVNFIDRKTQDDHKDKIQVSALVESPVIAEDVILPNLPNKDVQRYIIHVDDLEKFEEFYNFLNDQKEKYGCNYIYHMDEKYFTCDEQSKFRSILNAWN